MRKQGKERLFEVMGRLDKTFKPKLNEDFDFNKTQNPDEISQEMDVTDSGIDSEKEEKTIEEKYEELKNKVDELYAMIHDDNESEENQTSDEESGENEMDDEVETGEAENEIDEETKPKIPVADIAKVGKK